MRNLTFVFLLISFFELNAQTDKNYLLRTNFGYSFSHLDHTDAEQDWYNHVFGLKVSDFTYSFNGGKKLYSNFYYGLGLFYNISKQEINPDSDIPEISSSSGFVTMYSYNNSTSTEKTLSPIVFIQYFNNITDRFSLTFDLFSKYDFNKSTLNSISYTPDITTPTYIISGGDHTEIKKEYLSFGILPSLQFNIIKNIGMDFTFGIMEYRLKTKDSRVDNPENQSKEFKIGFKPENWLIGFYIKL